MTEAELVPSLEALLFAADRPASVEALAEATEQPIDAVRDGLALLGGRLSQTGPLQLVQIAGGYQLCTKPQFADVVARFTKPQRQRLGRSVMEVLAIVAYRQPVTLAEIEAVRGVQSDYGLRQLLERRLIRETGRKQTPGRPALYGTTQQFLHQFNMNDLQQLPELRLTLPGPQPALPDGTPSQDLPLPSESGEHGGEV